jgi:hypothetical protein
VVNTRPSYPQRLAAGHPPFPEYEEEEYDIMDDEPVIESGEGAVFRIAQASTGRVRKLQPSARVFHLPLAATTTNLINLAALEADSPSLAEVLAPIRSRDAFRDLFLVAHPVPRRRPLSRGMLQHETDLVDAYDLAEPVRWDVSDVLTLHDVVDTALAVYFFVWISLFIVPKKNNLGRLISDARPVNALQRPPGEMGLPRIHDIIRYVLTLEQAAKCDGVSYFYQFGLDESVRPYFKVRIAGHRGEIHELQLKRMPMGWKYSPRIAQHTSNFITRGVGVAWLDDFIIGGRSASEFSAHRKLFLERLIKYNVQVDDTELPPREQVTALGLEFDLVAKRYRLDASWVEKRSEKLDAYVAGAAAGQETTFRATYETFGTLIWAAHVSNKPLWVYAEAMQALSQAAKLCRGNYDDLFRLPSYAVRNVTEWVKDVKENPWMSSPPMQPTPTSFEHFVFSDASDVGEAFIEVIGESIVNESSWKRQETEHIFLAELDAMLAGARAATPGTDRLHVVDNSALNFAMRKGHSSSYEANKRFREAFGPNKPWSCWIPTHLMPADKGSRGQVYSAPVPRPVSTVELDAIRYITHDAFGDPRNRSEVPCVPGVETDESDTEE